jgi:antitoxin component YwqK of YwqJK toxin-antitoxin module
MIQNRLSRVPAIVKLMLVMLALHCCLPYMNAQTAAFTADNKLDAQGKKDGNWRKLDSIGHVQYEGQFRHGVPYGEFRYFYDTGKPRTIAQMADDGFTSKAVDFHPNGIKMAEGTYVNKLKDGEWVYYDEQGLLISKETYVEGKKHGLCTTYYNNGHLLEEKHYVNGVETGPWKQYFTDGGLKTDAVYSNGKLEGSAKFYFPDGKIAASGNYIHGLKDGVWVFMAEDGNKAKEDTYNTGQLVSTVDYNPQPVEEIKK